MAAMARDRSQCSVSSLGGCSWGLSQSQRLEPLDFWVKLPRRRPRSAPHRPPRPPSARPSAPSSRPASASRQARPVATPCTSRRQSSACRTRELAESSEDFKAPPLHEVPPEVLSKVLSMAQGGALVIEMQWSTSAYLPAHKNGQKYRDMAYKLQELMEGRRAQGSSLPVLTFDEPVKIRRSHVGMYDQFSDWERSFGLVASNSSYHLAAPSRVGAFEVHLVQDSWDPRLCVQPLEGGNHWGPPVNSSSGVVCQGCALRLQGRRGTGAGSPHYTLLHSKLWSRRWPGLRYLVGRIGAIVISAAPEVPHAVAIRVVDFEKQPCPELRRSAFPVTRCGVAAKLDPKQLVLEELSRLLRPTHLGWKVTDESEDVLGRCYGGMNSVRCSDVQLFLEDMGFHCASALSSFIWQHKRDWVGQPISAFIDCFLEQEMKHVLEVKRAQHQRYLKQREEEELAYQQLLRSMEQHLQDQERICEEHRLAHEESHAEAEQVYVSLCLFLIRRLPSHGFDLSRLERRLAEPREARRAVEAAVRLNEERGRSWRCWLEEVATWKRDDSSEEREIFEIITQQRPDIADMLAYEDHAHFNSLRLEEDIESFRKKMARAYPDVASYQGRIESLETSFERMVADYHRVCKS